MTITVNTKAYNLDAHVNANATAYAGPAQTFAVKDSMTLKRTAPKPTSTFPGVARSAIKLVRTVTISGVAYDAIVEVNASIPVGAAKADVDALREDLAGVLDSTTGDDVVWKHDLTH